MGRNPGELEQLILFAILRLEGDAYGVEVRRHVEERTGRSVSSGGIYTILQRLEERNLVRSEVGEGSPERGGRPRKRYELTPAGARALRDAYRAVTRMAEGALGQLDRLAEADGDG